MVLIVARSGLQALPGSGMVGQAAEQPRRP